MLHVILLVLTLYQPMGHRCPLSKKCGRTKGNVPPSPLRVYGVRVAAVSACTVGVTYCACCRVTQQTERGYARVVSYRQFIWTKKFCIQLFDMKFHRGDKWMPTKSILKILLLSVNFEIFNSINLWTYQSQQFYRTTTKFSGMTLIAFIINSIKYHLKLSSAKFLLPLISLKWTLYNYLLYGCAVLCSN